MDLSEVALVSLGCAILECPRIAPFDIFISSHFPYISSLLHCRLSVLKPSLSRKFSPFFIVCYFQFVGLLYLMNNIWPFHVSEQYLIQFIISF